MANFTSIVLKAVRPECVGISGLESWVNSHRSTPMTSPLKGWILVAGAVGLVVLTALIVVPLTLYLRPRANQHRSGNYDKMLLSPGEDI